MEVLHQYIGILVDMHTHACECMHRHTRTCTHTCAHTLLYTHTYTHTHIHIPPPPHTHTHVDMYTYLRNPIPVWPALVPCLSADEVTVNYAANLNEGLMKSIHLLPWILNCLSLDNPLWNEMADFSLSKIKVSVFSVNTYVARLS